MSRYWQRGLSLLELLLVLVVIAAITFVSVRYYTLARSNELVAEAVTRINAIVNASYQWVQGKKGNFCGPGEDGQNGSCTFNFRIEALMAKTTSNPDGSDLLPTGYEVNPLNPVINIRVLPSVPDGNHVQVQLMSIPISACNSLVEKLKAKAYQGQVECMRSFDRSKRTFSGAF